MRILQSHKSSLQWLAFRLWLTITGTGPVNLNLSFYSISSRLRPLFKSFLSNLKGTFQPTPILKRTQLSEVRRKHFIKFIVLDGKAYWSKDNQMFECAVEDGEIDNSKAVPLDAHSLSESQMNQLLSFLDNTT